MGDLRVDRWSSMTFKTAGMFRTLLLLCGAPTKSDFSFRRGASVIPVLQNPNPVTVRDHIVSQCQINFIPPCVYMLSE